MSNPPTDQPARKNRPLRGLAIILIALLAIPDTRHVILTPIGGLIAFLAGAAVALLMWSLTSMKQ